MTKEATRARRLRRTADTPWLGAELPWRTLAVALIAVLLVAAAGIALYFDERDTRRRPMLVGPAQNADRVDIEAAVQRTDPADHRMILRVRVTPQGRLLDPSGFPVTDVTLHAAASQEELRFTTASGVWIKDIEVPLLDGTSSDYPFDRYAADFGFAATTGQGKTAAQVPVRLAFHDEDPYFTYRTRESAYEGQFAYLNSEVVRSRSTFILAWFMIAAMWAVALAVVVACWLVVGQHRGLLWPALGWMAASLFALVGLRTAAPGSPPNGCLLDYLAFYWAEALIVLSLTVLVFHGILIEHRIGGPVPVTEAHAPARRGRLRLRRTRLRGGSVRGRRRGVHRFRG
ncbi:DUF4436 family protein [Streptomyces xanthophaeus]|uniref:DUF4436 family protein n=1 Tax=Streptomyces xanthophaeus TaxID=67385 RepID=UPI00398FD580